MDGFIYSDYFNDLPKIPEIVLPSDFITDSILGCWTPGAVRDVISNPVFTSVIIRVQGTPLFFSTYRNEDTDYIVFGKPVDTKGTMAFWYAEVLSDWKLGFLSANNTLLVDSVDPDGRTATSEDGTIQGIDLEKTEDELKCMGVVIFGVLRYIGRIGLSEIRCSIKRSKKQICALQSGKKRPPKKENVKYIKKNVYSLSSEQTAEILQMQIADAAREYTTIQWCRKGHWRTNKSGRTYFVRPTTVKRSENLLSERSMHKKSIYKVR